MILKTISWELCNGTEVSGSFCYPRFYQVVYLENVFGRLNTYKNVQANVCTHTACDEYGTVEFSAVMLSEVNISIYSLNLDNKSYIRWNNDVE